jgi:UDP-2,3-diacylglucosamine hydrolase
VVAIDRHVDGDLAAFPLTRVGWGEIGRILSTFRSAGCQDLVIVGGVTRPDLTQLRPDFGLVRNLPELLRVLFSGGDDGVLRAVVRFFEAKGFRVVSPAEIAPGLVVGAGPLTATTPTVAETQDILLGSSIVKALGVYDIGQAVIVSEGKLIAIEAAEGTDRMLARVALLRGGADAKRAAKGVLVKRPKPSQEMRVDLPAIGPATVARAADAGLAGIAVLTGMTLVAQRDELIANANAADVFVYGFTEGDAPHRVSGPTGWAVADATTLGRYGPGRSQLGDVRRGAAALGSLSSLAQAGAAVVNRGYVLGLDPAGDVGELIERSVRFKQWGEGRWRRRMGVLVLGEGRLLDPDIIARARAAKLAGIARMGDPPAANEDATIRAADEARMFVVRLAPSARMSSGGADV